MKIAFAQVLGGFQGLGNDDARERPVDRLAALAASQIARSKDSERSAALCSLGVDLIRFKLANIPAAKADAEDKLCAILGWRTADEKSTWDLHVSAGRRHSIARWAIQEWALDLCPVCKGATEIPDHSLPEREGRQPMKCCPGAPIGCGGTGRRRYTDAERVEAMGQAFDKAMAVAHSIIGRSESIAVKQAKEMLEHW